MKKILRCCLGIFIATELFIQYLIFKLGVPEVSNPDFQKFQQLVPIPYFIIQNFTMYLVIILIAQVIMFIYIGSWEKMRTNKRILLTLLAIAPLSWFWQLYIVLIETVFLFIAFIVVIIIFVISALAGRSTSDTQRNIERELREINRKL